MSSASYRRLTGVQQGVVVRPDTSVTGIGGTHAKGITANDSCLEIDKCSIMPITTGAYVDSY